MYKRQVQNVGGFSYQHQYSDFDENTQILVVVTDRDEGIGTSGFPNLREVPVLDQDSYGINQSQGLWYRTTTRNTGNALSGDTDHYIWVTRGGKVVTNSTVGVMRFRRST